MNGQTRLDFVVKWMIFILFLESSLSVYAAFGGGKLLNG